jgi:hypothetical protein
MYTIFCGEEKNRDAACALVSTKGAANRFPTDSVCFPHVKSLHSSRCIDILGKLQ